MQIATIQGEAREAAGKHANERIRRRGFIPAVIYGHGENPETVSLSLHDLEIALAHQQHVINLQVGGRDAQYLIKEVQYDHLQRTPLHVDLMRISSKDRVKVRVALELKGTPEGTRQGGVMLQSMADIEVECAVMDIPETIRINIEGLKFNQSLHVREIELPAGVTALSDPEAVVVAVKPKRDEVAPAAAVEGGPVEPEVIGRVAKEAEGEEGKEAKK